MRIIAKAIVAVVICTVLFGNCFAEESPGASKLIKAAKLFIQDGNTAKAVATLDTAFNLANSAGDYDALMDIGDLYIAADPNMKNKAVEAWNAAGHWKVASP